MDPDMELHYKELLHQWKIDEDNIKDELKEIGLGVKEITTDVKDISTDVKDISTSVKELTKKLDHLAVSNVNPVRETNDGGERPFKDYCRSCTTLPSLNKIS